MPEPSQQRTFCLTIGDSGGIGPEIAVKFLHRLSQQPDGHRIRVFGDIPELRRMSERLTLPLPLPDASWASYTDISAACSDAPPEARIGRIAYQSLEAAVAEMHCGAAHALVTGPISKERLREAGLPFTGHTEILQHLARQYYGRLYQSDMLFLYGSFRMLLLTRHVPLRAVSEALSVKKVARSLLSLSDFLLNRARISHPRVCMLGVNPHAGELEADLNEKGVDAASRPSGQPSGQPPGQPSGQEEARILKPAIRLVSRRRPVEIAPPVAADAAFRGFNAHHPPADAYVAAYHDQGLIPFKMAAGLDAVNVTIGLPFLRTSVSHGTAPDIAGQNLADPASLIAAYQSALQLTAPV